MPEDPNAPNPNTEVEKPKVDGDNAPKQDGEQKPVPPIGYVPEENYKNLQRKLANLETRRADEATLARGIGQVLNKVNLLEEVIMTQLPADSEQATKLKARQGQDAQWQERVQSAAAEVDAIAQTYGVTAEQIQTGEEFEDFRNLWAKGHVDAAKADFTATAKSIKMGGKKVVEQKPAPKEQTQPSEDVIEKAVTERLKKLGISPSVVDTKTAEGNQPKQKIWTKSEVAALPPDEFEKHFEEILTAQNEGRFRKG